MIGSKLLHYEVTGKLGEGGMGEVYRATDSKLGREVAIKVLPAAFVEDPERLARFEREARVLAALEHPNIAGIYGLEEADGKQLLVMQLAPGEDLSVRLARGPMTRDEVLPIALQIAQALEAAHDRGIVHRDLKPANVMLAPDGTVKVLDFGLAKAWDDGTPGSDPNLTASPTLTAQMTQAGVILGTAGYMSPEQARGQEADRRSDIWSFGVVLHEMLTGKRMFQADTVSDTLARVLMAEPDWESIDSDLPRPIAALLRRCLERDTARRLQAIGEARIAIEGYLADPNSATTAKADSELTPPASGSGAWLRAATVGVLGVAAGWLLSLALSSPRAAGDGSETLRFAIQPPSESAIVTEDVNGVAISRDGRKVAFIASSAESPTPVIYVKGLGEAEARPIPGTEDARSPTFSPDGEWIAYFIQGQLRKINLLGGRPVDLAPTQDRRGIAWNTDGYIYFVPQSSSGVVRIPETGGPVEPVTELDEARRERTHRWPSLLPGGKGLLFTSDTFESTEYYDDARIELVDLESGERKVVLEGSSRAAWFASGHLLFARDGSLYAVPFDLDRWRTTGTPQLALQGVSTIVASGAVQFDLSESGSLAYIPGGKTTDIFDLTWIGADGVETVATELGQYFQASMSPDGRRVALTSASQDSRNLWIYDLDRETSSRLTFEATNSEPVWSPDGDFLYFASDRDSTQTRPYRKAADGSGKAELIWDAPRSTVPVDITPDGNLLLVSMRAANEATTAGQSLWVVHLDGEREPWEFLSEAVSGTWASLSPDGRYVAYISIEGDSPLVYVQPFPDGAGKWQISNVPSREPRWSPDGKRLYFRSIEGLKFTELDLTDGFRSGAPQVFHRGEMGPPFNLTFSFSPDSRRLLVLTPHVAEEQEWVIHVALNWKAELERMLDPVP